jgi:hypothetical protein
MLEEEKEKKRRTGKIDQQDKHETLHRTMFERSVITRIRRLIKVKVYRRL